MYSNFETFWNLYLVLVRSQGRFVIQLIKVFKMSSKVVCPQHPDAPTIEDYRAGDMICSECGLVIGDRVIDVGSEWRTFSNEKGGDDRSRVGGPENALLGGGDLSTMIGPSTGAASFDADGKAIYTNRRTVSSSDRTLINAFRSISNMADRINLTKTITDRANQLFKMVHDGRRCVMVI